ncbi:MAG TPA: 4Fe-4S binding protein [Methanocorpusculum sp.]|nr:4Fe-4S binding protein [Methanocorpusculum sp.]
MSTIYPKYSRKREGDTEIIEQHLLTTVTHLHLFLTRCTGCGVCVDACPKNAILLGMVGASIRGLTEDAPIYIDPVICSYCGVCVILCPYDALRLDIDDKPRLPIREQDGFPTYDITAEIDQEKCVRCTICNEVCPNNAIINETPIFEGVGEDGVPRQNALDAKTTFTLEMDKCTFCGICSVLCPAITLKRVPFNPEFLGNDGKILWNEALCDACHVCAEACPHDVITVERKVFTKAKLPGKVSINIVRCIFCNWCEQSCPSKAITIRMAFVGVIHIDTWKCPGGCSTCVDICPCRALYLPIPIPVSEMNRNSIRPNIAINHKLCNVCGACVNACPSEDAISMRRTGIHVKGEETDLYKKILAKLCVPRTSKVVESTFGTVETKVLPPIKKRSISHDIL